MIAMYVSICVHSNPYYVASCSPRPSFFATMTDVGTLALLKKWADAVALRTVHRGVYSPDSTRTVSWTSLENCAWSTLDTPVALVKVTHPGVAQPHCLTDPLLSLFDNNPNPQAIVLQLHDSDARAVVEHVKKSCGGPNRGMSLYLREWEMQDGSPGIHVSGHLAAGWRKWECKASKCSGGIGRTPPPSTPSTPNRHGPGMPIWRATPSPPGTRVLGCTPPFSSPSPPPPFLVLDTIVSPSPLTSSIIVMSTTSRISSNGAMLSNLASFLSIGWTSFRMSMGNLGEMRGSIFLMRIGPPRLVQGTETPAAH